MRENLDDTRRMEAEKEEGYSQGKAPRPPAPSRPRSLLDRLRAYWSQMAQPPLPRPPLPPSPPRRPTGLPLEDVYQGLRRFGSAGLAWGPPILQPEENPRITREQIVAELREILSLLPPA